MKIWDNFKARIQAYTVSIEGLMLGGLVSMIVGGVLVLLKPVLIVVPVFFLCLYLALKVARYEGKI